VLATLTAVCLAAPPQVAVLATDPAGSTTDLYFQRVGEAKLSAPVARLHHAPGATVLGAALPRTRTVLAIAGVVDGRDASFASALFRLEEGKREALLVDRVYQYTRPLVTTSGRVFAVCGAPGEEPPLEAAKQGRLRDDAFTVEEVDPLTAQARVVHRYRGYLAFLAGALETRGALELLLYRVEFGRAELVAVDADTLAVRVLAAPILPYARDFSVDSGARALWYTQADPARGDWYVERLDLDSLRREAVVRGATMALAPHAWPGGRLAWNADPESGLSVLGAGAVAARPAGAGVDFVQFFSPDGALAAGLHTRPGELSAPFALRVADGQAELLASPPGMRVELAGFVEGAR